MNSLSSRPICGHVAREILVPVQRVIAIYARENGQGMAFPMSVPTDGDSNAGDAQGADKPPELQQRPMWFSWCIQRLMVPMRTVDQNPPLTPSKVLGRLLKRIK
jgi:hypothetical protein